MPDNGMVHLVWSAPPDNGSPITKYRVYRGTTSGGETFLIDTNFIIQIDFSVVNGGFYCY